MAALKTNFLDKVLGRIGRLDKEGLQTVVQRLARERSFLETLFNTIEDGVLVVDESGRIIYCNQAVTRLLGLRFDQAEGQPVQQWLPQLDWTKLCGGGAQGGNRILRHEVEVSYPQPRFLRLYAASLDGDNAGESGVALILHDATEARLQTFAAIESERMQALTLLAASVAHEIGNPLNALHIHLQLMEREIRKLREEGGGKPVRRSPRRASQAGGSDGAVVAEVCGRLEQYAAVAKGEITRLDYIITQFLQAIRPTQPQKRVVSLNDLIHETLSLLGPELENRGLTVREKLDRDLPKASLDPVQIRQVLVNLIKNAMQAMTRGGTLTLLSGLDGEHLWFSVQDTGVGIPRDQVSRIFEPFYTTKKKGTGLGLMIVQRIVREHGGRMELESEAGKGTVFRCWLPLHEKGPRLLEARLHD